MAEGTQLTSWFETAKGEVPLPLTGPSLSLSPVHPQTVFLFGGKVVPARRLTAEMWAFDLTAQTWSRVNTGPGPGPRYFHSMDTWRDMLVCFGGMSDADALHVHNDIWMFDCRSRRWLPQPSPETPLQDPAHVPQARYAHLSSVSRGQLCVCGGQRSDNTWIYEMNVYDLETGIWVSKTEQPESHGLHSKGAYRSVASSSSQRVIVPPGDAHTVAGAPALSYSVDEVGGGGDIWCYSNYDFAKVRRELEVMTPLDGAAEIPTSSDKFVSPPGFNMADLSSKMGGSSQPPGLRFPAGGIIGHHFILCGLYLASTSAAFSIWTLDMTTMTWKHLEPQVLATGSWNRAVLCPETARLLVFGNAQSDLATDYGKRAVNLDHLAVVELEAYGIYHPPKLLLSERNQDMGLTILDEKLLCDFEIVCEDGRRIKCSRKLLMERWTWFAEQQTALLAKAAMIVQETPSLDLNDALLGSLSPARFTPSRLHIPEPLPVCVALIQYFYTLHLSTPLQTRAPVLSALLFLSKQYKMTHLNQLVVHALHSRLEPSTAVGVYEVATLAGERNLAARALQLIHLTKNGGTTRGHSRGPGSIATNDGSQGSNQTPPLPSMSGLPDVAGGPYAPSSANHGSEGGGGAVFRQARVCPDSFTFPERGPIESFASDETVKGGPDSVLFELLEALDLSSAPPPSPILRPVPSPRRRHARSRSTSMSSTSTCSTRSNLSPRRLPPLLPPPHRPLPIRPVDGLMTPPVTPRTVETLRSPSPTNSDATSQYLPTPSDSTRNSRDSAFLTRETSPSTPSGSFSERRPSFSGTPSKTCLPSLPEDEMASETASHFSFDASESGRGGGHVTVPAVLVVEDTSTATVSATSTLHLHQRGALDSLSGQTMLTRTASLNALGLARPPSSLESFESTATPRREGLTSSSSASILSEAGAASRTSPTSSSNSRWATSTSTLVVAAEPKARHVSIRGERKPTEDEERQRLLKFQHFMAEQQRAAGLSPAEAFATARRATGKAGQHRSSLRRFGAKLMGGGGGGGGGGGDGWWDADM